MTKHKCVPVIVLLALMLSGCGLFARRESCDDPAKYTDYFGSGSERIVLIESDIFPQALPESARVEQFSYNYYDPWDPCFANLLVYTCNEADYAAEVARLEALESNDWAGLYGISGFPQTLLSFRGNVYGTVYAMGDPDACRLIYGEVTFCNYFTDMNYGAIIDEAYLPDGFDATYDNPIRKAFDEGADMHQFFDLLNP